MSDQARAATPEEEVERLGELVAQLETALESRVVIEQAKGVLAERLGLEVTDAFALLRYSARAGRVKIHDLAAEVVSSRATPPAIVVGLARAQRWRAAAQRERAEAVRERATEQQRRAQETDPAHRRNDP